MAALLLSTSSVALHAQDRDLQKELDSLKAQINSLKAAIGEQRTETRKNKEKIKVVADRAVAPVVGTRGAPGFTSGGFQPIGGFDDKKLHFGGITITPGGYIAADYFFRSRSTGADVTTPYGAIPFPNSPLANTNETRFSAKQSRIALLVEANISKSILGAAYFEGDFNSAGATTNFTQTNSFTFRERNVYATLDFLDSGFHVLAGQNWSLITLNSKGITPRNEITPPTIDSGIFVGYLYARNPQLRLVKDFDKKLWLAVSVESPTTVISTTGAPIGLTTTTTETAGALGNAANGATTSLAHIPDVFVKAAYEASIAGRDVHLEALGGYRNFYDRVNYGNLIAASGAATAGNSGFFTGNSSSKNSDGFIVGAGLLVPILPKVLDLQAGGNYGRGLGRFSPSGDPDATLRADGSLSGIRAIAGTAGLTYHATSAVDIYGFAGYDQVFANYSQTSPTTFVGYGTPDANNNGCFIEGGTCAGSTKSTFELSAGVWDKIYQGDFGYFRVGAQYQYVKRTLQAGLNGNSPSIDEHILAASFRYFPF